VINNRLKVVETKVRDPKMEEAREIKMQM